MAEDDADALIRDQARIAREQEAAIIAVCNCAWPIVTFRNMTGHHPDCPAHAMTLERFRGGGRR